MIPRRDAAAATSGGGVPPLSLPFSSSSASQPAAGDEEEEAALAVSDQRTLYLVNIFIGNTARFLNSFSALCEDKLAQVHRRISLLDATLTLLEAKLKSTSPSLEFEENRGLEAIGSSSQSMPKNEVPNAPSGSMNLQELSEVT